MGNYVYSVRRKFIKVRLNDDTTIHAWYLKYHYKPHWGTFRDNDLIYQNQIERMEKIWQQHNEKPDYIVSIDEKPQEGDQVKKWPGHISCHDANGLPGELLGYLKRDGKKWTITQIEPDPLSRFVSKTDESLTPVTDNPILSS